MAKLIYALGFCILVIGTLPVCQAGDEKARNVMKLWQADMPGTIANATPEKLLKKGRVSNVHQPTLTHFPATGKASGSAVVICPGGGYAKLAIEKEGSRIAEWLNTLGIHAFVLKYRHKPYKHPIPLIDAQQAIRIVRSRGEEWGIASDKIGIMGFSAGGHLASTVLTHEGNAVAVDGELADVSCAPNFAILGYSVVSMADDALCHRGSRQNLLGEPPSDELKRQLSADLQVTAQTSPVFLFHAKDDSAVPVENSIHFYEALKSVGVATELFLLKKGGHGFALNRNDWAEPCRKWLLEQKLVSQ